MISFKGIEKTYQLGSQHVEAFKKVDGFIKIEGITGKEMAHDKFMNL